MPHHQTKKSVRKSLRSLSKRPTMKEHGYRIVSHHAPSSGVKRSVKNIYRSIANIVPKNKVNQMNMNIQRAYRESLARTAKSRYQQEREEKKRQNEIKSVLKNEKKKEKKEHEKRMNELNALMKML